MYPPEVSAQRLDLKVLGNARRIELPFDLENDFIVISVLLNNAFPLRFIVDTGAENTVILDKTVTDILDINYRRTFEIRGSDVETVLVAYLATGVNLRLANRLLARNRSVLVLEENYINFERITGTNINGILGADFLSRFVVEIDFKKQVIVLHDPGKFKPRRKHIAVPADFIRNRPYLQLPVGVTTNTPTARRLLLDSGAGLSLLMHTFPDTNRVDLPEQTIPAYIASGLGGTLEGSVGRSRVLELANRQLTNVVTYFQEIDTANADFLNRREGILGNRVLKRFNVVIDYVRQEVYFRPEGRIWKRKFRYDRSGISVIAGGKALRKYSVSSVVPGSPADRAGVRVRDRIRAVNGVPIGLLTLEGIIKKLEGKVGRKIRLRVYRAGRIEEFEFRLEDLI